MTEHHHINLLHRLRALVSESAEVVLVAPFARASIVDDLVSHLAEHAHAVVFTRWRVEEVAHGVSDLEVFDVLEARGLPLHLVSNLHAKYYRGDGSVLVGSGNLTNDGLRYPRGNLELLAELSFDDGFVEFESVLESTAYPATRELRHEMERAADAMAVSWEERAFPLRSANPHQPEHASVNHARLSSDWLPSTREPSDLWKAYSGEYDRLSTAAQGAARHDLRFLDLPRGLSEDAFRAALRTRLYDVALIRHIDLFAQRSRRFGEMRDLLAERPEIERTGRNPSHAWQTMFAWLLHFMPDRYRAWTTNYSEIFQKRDLSTDA